MTHRVFNSILLISLGLFAICAQGAESPKWLAQIQQGLDQALGSRVVHMAEKMGLSDYRHELHVSYIDPRLNFAPCGHELNIDIPTSLELGRSHIKVACSAPSPWALNVPVDIHLYAPVVVLNQPVGRDTRFKLRHLSMETHNLADLRNGYFIKKSQVIGKQSKRALSGHTVLNGHLIDAALMVVKGDKVLIVAKKGPMQVKMPGEALNNGREGRQIRVKNLSSERIIKAKVVGPGLVQVNF